MHTVSNDINNISDDDGYQLWDIINRDQAEPMFQLQAKLKLFWPSFTETESVYGTTETRTLELLSHNTAENSLIIFPLKCHTSDNRH